VRFITSEATDALSKTLENLGAKLTVSGKGDLYINLVRAKNLTEYDLRRIEFILGEYTKSIGGKLETVKSGASYVINDVKAMVSGITTKNVLKDLELITSQRVIGGEIKWLDTITQSQYDALLKSGVLSANKIVSSKSVGAVEIGIAKDLYDDLIKNGATASQAAKVVYETVQNGSVSGVTLAVSMGLSANTIGSISASGRTIQANGSIISKNFNTEQARATFNALLEPSLEKISEKLSHEPTSTLIFALSVINAQVFESLVPKLDTATIQELVQSPKLDSNQREKLIQNLSTEQTQMLIQNLNIDQIQELIQVQTQEQTQEIIPLLTTVQITKLIKKLPPLKRKPLIEALEKKKGSEKDKFVVTFTDYGGRVEVLNVKASTFREAYWRAFHIRRWHGLQHIVDIFKKGKS
jgi:hypothetical protein